MPIIKADRLARISAALLLRPKAAGRVFYPGEIEGLREQQRLRDGIEIEDATWENLRALAREYRLGSVLDLA
ncbi:hypothetical protein [Bradyrhizobium sp. CSA207]|uniref:hypothetical protein n=1 Tax=Bradyrhizobium sp. CSA207 TaxID=2698826 RepID=UPI0023B1DC95|nr:hypothetical protein [Bradyrhizobium sp. CSA207]